MGMRKKTLSAKDYNGPKKVPSSDQASPYLKLKPKKKAKRK